MHRRNPQDSQSRHPNNTANYDSPMAPVEVQHDMAAKTLLNSTLPAGQTCDSASPRTRSFSSFSEAAEENGLSRILVGFHFRHAGEEGILHGQKIGGWVVTHALRPEHSEDSDDR